MNNENFIDADLLLGLVVFDCLRKSNVVMLSSSRRYAFAVRLRYVMKSFPPECDEFSKIQWNIQASGSPENTSWNLLSFRSCACLLWLRCILSLCLCRYICPSEEGEGRRLSRMEGMFFGVFCVWVIVDNRRTARWLTVTLEDSNSSVGVTRANCSFQP